MRSIYEHSYRQYARRALRRDFPTYSIVNYARFVVYCTIISFPGVVAIYSALVVSSTAKFFDAVSELLPNGLFCPVDLAGSPAEARQIARERNYDTMFINASPGDAEAKRLSLDAAAAGAIVLLLLPAAELDIMREELRDGGVLTLSKPVSLGAVAQAADHMCTVAKLLGAGRRSAAKAEARLEDVSIINRAKWLLIDNLKMTEAEAHRYIERQAMDRCVTRRQVAEGILKTYKTV